MMPGSHGDKPVAAPVAPALVVSALFVVQTTASHVQRTWSALAALDLVVVALSLSVSVAFPFVDVWPSHFLAAAAEEHADEYGLQGAEGSSLCTAHCIRGTQIGK